MEPTIESIDSEDAAVAYLMAQDAPAEDADPDLPEPEEEPEEEEAADAEEPTDDAEVEEEASEADEEDEEAPQEPQLFTVKVDGKERRVTLEELTRDFSGRASIERRIQEAETARQQATALAQAAAREAAQVQAIAAQVQATGILPRPTMPDPRLAETNAAAWAKAQAKFQVDATAWQAQQQQLQYVAQVRARQEAQAKQAHNVEQARKLAEALPVFAKPETAAKRWDELVAIGQDYGFSQKEIDAETDARKVQVLHDAAQWREHKARLTEARKAPTQTPRHVTPAAKARAPMSEERKAVLALRKTRSVDDAVRVLLARDNS